MTTARRMAIGLGTANLTALVLIAAVSANDGSWGTGFRSLPPDALPVSEVARKLEHQGLARIYKIEADGSTYHVRAVDTVGRRVEVSVDPRSGIVVR
ncbi:PepSY domain-containing protein [Azospirillum halopraeferens]|uniref:PepSY domain-containing protein n=1 Tax=Azospirillum halopraeferens TaxID=34010 RepID=UPI00042921EB|nr:PepSY domain-containing protein [Azospirillum halopraeferens]